MSAVERRVSCDRVAEQLGRVLDGSASAELLAHVVDCDACRDARYEAERARDLVNQAGHDFQLPEGLESTLAAQTRAPSSPITPLTATPRATGPFRALAKRWALPVFAATAVAAVLLGRGKSSGTSTDDPELVGPPWRGKVARVLTRTGKLELCAPGGSACHEARVGDEIPAGSELRTDRGTLAELAFSDGSNVSLDRATTLRLSTRGRGGELVRGAVVADVKPQAHVSVRFEFTSGHLDVLGTKFSLRSDDESAVVHVARGEVRLCNRSGSEAVVRTGEEGRVDAGAAPVTSPTSSLGEALGWSEAVKLDRPDDGPEARPRALGELKAQKPGEKSERSGAVSLASHSVRVKIAGSVARTEVEELFTNHTDDVLEGIFRFPLPPDAKIERLALEVDGKLEEGAFVDRDRASAIWRGAIVNAAPQLRREIKDEIVWVPGPWRDPALLEWQRGGRFELRIFPIPRRGSRRVVLAYSQVVKQAATVRHYSYPLAFDPSGNGTPLDFSLDVVLRGNDPAFRVRTPGWDVSRHQADGAEHLHFDARSFVPSGDFSVDYALPDRDAELSAWAYRDPSATGDAYVALALRPRLPRQREHGPARSVALVVDASRSVFGENYRRATALATRLARDLDAGDRVTVLACDSTCREMPGDLRRPGTDTAHEVRRFLEQRTPEGASDITLAVARGFASLAASDRSPHVVYIGDGTATVGPIRPATIERAVRAALPNGGRVSALGIGPESDADSLLALSRGGGGTALPYVPGQPLADVALTAISALSGASLSDVQLELPAGITQLAPARLDAITVGSELLVTGRLSGAQLEGAAVLRGRVDGRPFEQRYPLALSVSDSSGNAFVPRLFAAARIADLERDGSDGAKREAIALSTQHRVASRYTSLLVLESEAMYKAFGLESARKTPDYTADLEAEGDSASGELALSDDETQSLEKDVRGSGTAKNPVSSEPSSRTAGAPAAKAAAAAPRGAPAVDVSEPFARDSAEASRGPTFAPPPAPVTAEPRRERAAPEKKRPSRVEAEPPFELAPPRPRPMIAMRRIWQRHGEIFTDHFVPARANASALTDAERALQRDDSRRQYLKQAFALSSAAGDLSQAAQLAERWVDKEPLDPEAITALADVEARRGRREVAIRLLGSVLDVRPGDTASHKRLARLERWAGHAELGCRHTIAIAEGRSRDLALVADAVRCTRALGMSELAEALLDSAEYSERALIERRARQTPDDDARLSGDVQLEARWNGGPDLDLSLLDTEGHRISWLGAATRSVISARDVTSSTFESLALRGAAPGEYVVELTRGAGVGSAQGELVVTVAGNVRRIPFAFDGDRKAVALVRISMRPHLVTL
jgi:Mg-chelatase subunit ChlD